LTEDPVLTGAAGPATAISMSDFGKSSFSSNGLANGHSLPAPISTVQETGIEPPEHIARDVYSVQQIQAVPTLLEVLCEITGMRFAAVVLSLQVVGRYVP